MQYRENKHVINICIVKTTCSAVDNFLALHSSLAFKDWIRLHIYQGPYSVLTHVRHLSSSDALYNTAAGS